MKKNPTNERNAMRTLGKIVKFIIIAYVTLFVLLMGMILMTNAMLAGMGG